MFDAVALKMSKSQAFKWSIVNRNTLNICGNSGWTKSYNTIYWILFSVFSSFTERLLWDHPLNELGNISATSNIHACVYLGLKIFLVKKTDASWWQTHVQFPSMLSLRVGSNTKTSIYTFQCEVSKDKTFLK